MRFLENGPDIPDELLVARDQERVVFFCGSGVSMARADMPGLFDLAKRVLDGLGARSDSMACKFLDKARKLNRCMGESGILPMDRFFTLLEREFSEADIENAVARHLRPGIDVDCSAHEILVDLATQGGATRIVTTNFDRLFHCCGRPTLAAWLAPRLPDPDRPKEMNGVVYLHGRVDVRYEKAEGDPFVLSSSSFGKAYLTEGWATAFLRKVLDAYAVVFVGYSADDPPVAYLLEALHSTARNRRKGRLKGTVQCLDEVYAFQGDDDRNATAKWKHRGVKTISYRSNDRHENLWETLDAWRRRTGDLERWRDSVVRLAKRGPENLSPFERGQVAHLVSTKEGARRFAKCGPPATWLCVFDRVRRYAPPGTENGERIDPFVRYTLDSDTPPALSERDGCSNERETPAEAWDAFDLNERDRADLRDDNVPGFRGRQVHGSAVLPDRLDELGEWLASVSDESAAVWWAARQCGLHPSVQEKIRLRWSQRRSSFSQAVAQAWNYLFESWSSDHASRHGELSLFEGKLATIEWTAPTIRRFELLDCPRMTAVASWHHTVLPPQRGDETRLGDLVSCDIVYPAEPFEEGFSVPSAWLRNVVAACKRNLEVAVRLETERGSYRWRNVPALMRDNGSDELSEHRRYGLSGAVLRYVALFERLAGRDPVAARHEVSTWPEADDRVYARLRIWSCNFPEVADGDRVGKIFARLSEEAFWKSEHQHDFLLTLRARWPNLSLPVKEAIMRRILAGPPRLANESDNAFNERRASSSLNRVQWLKDNGCEL